jgi:hypothetical protein
LTLLRWLRASYRYQLGTDLLEKAMVAASRAGSVTAAEKSQARADINGLLGLCNDQYGERWHPWDGPSPYDDIFAAGSLSADTASRSLTALKEAAKKEIADAAAISGCDTKLLCSPSIGQIVSLVGSDTTSIPIGRVQKKVRLPQALHAMQPDDGEDASTSGAGAAGQEAQAMDTRLGAETDSLEGLDDVDVIFGVDYMKILSSLLRAVRRDAKRCQQEEMAATGLSSRGASLAPHHSFILQADYVMRGVIGGELQRTLVYWRHNSAEYRVGVLNVPEVIPAKSPQTYSVERLSTWNTRGQINVFDPQRYKYVGIAHTEPVQIDAYNIVYTCPVEYRENVGNRRVRLLTLCV